MHRIIPYFFKPGSIEVPALDTDVAFTQTPQYFPEMSDALDFLDNNNAQFFRLNCMLRNCCGGVSSCGTNGTWLIPPREGSIWEEGSTGRVLGQLKNNHKFERRYFHESCKIEDTASSLARVVEGKRSQYANWHLSYGMTKNPTDYLAAVQRWAEGGVVLSLQTFLQWPRHQLHLVWVMLIIYVLFVYRLFDAAMQSPEDYEGGNLKELRDNLVPTFHQEWVAWWNQRFMDLMSFLGESFGEEYIEVELRMHATTFTAAITLAVAIIAQLVVLLLFTEIAGHLFRRCGYSLLPTGGRWWARLMISLDNLTYFLWFWNSFFWIVFNYISVFTRKSFFYDSTLMASFAFVTQGLSWGLILSATARYSAKEMFEGNEVTLIAIDNLWRSTQLFYITAPLLMYSILMGGLDYIKWRAYNQDISYWVGGDRGAMSKNIVKYWTLFLILGVFVAWIFFLSGKMPTDNMEAGLPSVIIVTLIGLDVLHPCAYLWLSDAHKGYPKEVLKARHAMAEMAGVTFDKPADGKKVEEKKTVDDKKGDDKKPEGDNMPRTSPRGAGTPRKRAPPPVEKRGDERGRRLEDFQVGWLWKLTNLVWYKATLYELILNGWTTTFVKFLGPVSQVCMPFLMLVLPSLGFNQAFTLLITAGMR